MIVFEVIIMVPTSELQFILSGISKALGYIHNSAEKFRKESGFDSSGISVDNCIVRPPDPSVLISPIGCTTILVRGEIAVLPKSYHLDKQNTKIGSMEWEDCPTKISSGGSELSTDQMCVWLTRYLHTFCVEHLESRDKDFTYLVVGCFNSGTLELVMCKYDARGFGSAGYNHVILYQDRYDLLDYITKKQKEGVGNPYNVIDHFVNNRPKDDWISVDDVEQFSNIGLFSNRELSELSTKWDAFNWKEEVSEQKEKESNEHTSTQA